MMVLKTVVVDIRFLSIDDYHSISRQYCTLLIRDLIEIAPSLIYKSPFSTFSGTDQVNLSKNSIKSDHIFPGIEIENHMFPS